MRILMRFDITGFVFLDMYQLNIFYYTDPLGYQHVANLFAVEQAIA
jgi:hypothetical protein